MRRIRWVGEKRKGKFDWLWFSKPIPTENESGEEEGSPKIGNMRLMTLHQQRGNADTVSAVRRSLPCHWQSFGHSFPKWSWSDSSPDACDRTPTEWRSRSWRRCSRRWSGRRQESLRFGKEHRALEISREKRSHCGGDSWPEAWFRPRRAVGMWKAGKREPRWGSCVQEKSPSSHHAAEDCLTQADMLSWGGRAQLKDQWSPSRYSSLVEREKTSSEYRISERDKRQCPYRCG